MAVGAIGATRAFNNISFVQPLNYRVKNESAVSEAYAESVQQPSAVSGAVDAVAPVSYPTAQKSSAKRPDAIAASAMYNAVAAGFQGNVTGYSANAEGSSYGMVGSSIDLMI